MELEAIFEAEAQEEQMMTNETTVPWTNSSTCSSSSKKPLKQQQDSEVPVNEIERMLASSAKRRLLPSLTPPLPTQRLRRTNNVVNKLHLFARHAHTPGSRIANQRTCYGNIYPNKTHILEEQTIPPVYIRKFSPDGRYLLTYSRSYGQSRIDVFRFKGGFHPPDQEHLSSSLWATYFALLFSTNFPSHENLNKEFCLFSADCSFLIIASSQQSGHVHTPLRRKVHSDSLTAIPQLDDISFYVIDMADGRICSKKTFERDFIHLNSPHSCGMSLYRDMVGVLSVQNQQIHLFKLKENGELVNIVNIGEYCAQDDALYMSNFRHLYKRPTLPGPPSSMADIFDVPHVPEASSSSPPDDGSEDFGSLNGGSHFPLEGTPPLSCFKQRLLSFLFAQAHSSCNRPAALRFFYSHFEEFKALCLWKFQFIDDEHLFIKLSTVENVISRQESTGYIAFFVVYNFIKCSIVSIYENNDVGLLNAYEKASSYFRISSFFEGGYTSLLTPSNCHHAREVFRKTLSGVRNARNGGLDQSYRRGLAAVPVSSQVFRESPYFDPSLFSFDDKHISAVERVKPCQETPLKFFSRIHGGLLFTIQPNAPNSRQNSRVKKVASYIFHPFLPFAITVQHSISGTQLTASVYCFHLRE